MNLHVDTLGYTEGESVNLDLTMPGGKKKNYTVNVDRYGVGKIMSEIIVKVENVVVSIEPKRPPFKKLWDEYKKIMKFMKDAQDTLINDSSRVINDEFEEEVYHEKVHVIYNKIGGEIAKLHDNEDTYNKSHTGVDSHSSYQNSCALRLSEALNQSGFIIKGGTINPDKNILRNSGKVYTSSNGKKYHYRYIMQVNGIKTYLKTRWGILI